MKKFLSTCMAFFCLLILPVSAVADIMISFDELGSAPITFISAVPLTTEYSGVTFSGPRAIDGGAILDQGSNFGMLSAHSGRNFLAFNRGATMGNSGIPTDPETIVFTDLWKTVSIYAAGGDSMDTFLMQAFDIDDNLVDAASISTQGWDLLAVSWEGGIRKVVLTQTGDNNLFVYDDLRATNSSAPVAEPMSLLLLAAGLAGLAGVRSRRRH